MFWENKKRNVIILFVNELGKAFEEVTLSADRLASFANELNNG
ncbi:hypothetical protein [Lysinibacillus sp. NPDC093688]